MCPECSKAIKENERYQICSACKRNYHLSHRCPLHPNARMIIKEEGNIFNNARPRIRTFRPKPAEEIKPAFYHRWAIGAIAGVFLIIGIVTSVLRMDLEDSQLLFSDSFDDNRNGWYTESNRAYISQGTYHLNAPFTVWKQTPQRNFSNFVYEVTTTKISGVNDWSYGLIFGHNSLNYYTFAISGDGYFGLSKLLNRQFLALIPWTASNAIRRGNLFPNRLKVVCEGPLIKLYINDTFVRQGFDTSFSHEGIGFYANKDIHATFDNVKVYALK